MGVPEPHLGSYQWVWDAVCIVAGGSAWPKGDEDKLRELADAWRDLNELLGKAINAADTATVDVLQNWGGDAGTALNEYWNNLGVGPDTGLPMVAQVASSFAQGLDSTALEIEYTKLVVLITVIITVISIFIALLMAW